MTKELLELYAFIGQKVIEKYEAGHGSQRLLAYIAGADAVLRGQPVDSCMEQIMRVEAIVDNKRLMEQMNQAIDERINQLIVDSQSKVVKEEQIRMDWTNIDTTPGD